MAMYGSARTTWLLFCALSFGAGFAIAGSYLLRPDRRHHVPRQTAKPVDKALNALPEFPDLYKIDEKLSADDVRAIRSLVDGQDDALPIRSIRIIERGREDASEGRAGDVEVWTLVKGSDSEWGDWGDQFVIRKEGGKWSVVSRKRFDH